MRVVYHSCGETVYSFCVQRNRHLHALPAYLCHSLWHSFYLSYEDFSILFLAMITLLTLLSVW